MISISHWGMFEDQPKMVPFGITGQLLVNAELLDPPKHEWSSDYYDAKYLHG